MCEHDSDSYESDAQTKTEIKLYETEGGYLVFAVRMEYHPIFDEWFPGNTTLLGFGEVDDWELISEALRELGMNPSMIQELHELPIEGEGIITP